MKLLVILVAITALCAGSTIPLVPRDNSHYVEGESRYIWMPDGDGNLILVDLEAFDDEESFSARNGAQNSYWLFTRRNRSNRQVLINGDANSIRNSNYNGNRPTVVIVHGWTSNGNANWIGQTTKAFLDNADVNVIVLDWKRDASRTYRSSMRAVPVVGRELANFLNFIFNTAGGNWNNVHLVGHSLGAHVVGNAGQAVSGRPARITGLDPAGPYWGRHSDALKSSCGVYVESIHTNDILGISKDVSNVDFFPNGGKNQPGCWNMYCDHERAHELFAASITGNHLVGRRCSNLREAKRNQCTGANLAFGNANLEKRGSGIYALTTRNVWPF